MMLQVFIFEENRNQTDPYATKP